VHVGPSSLARPLLTGQGLSTGAVRVVQIDSTASQRARERGRAREKDTAIERAAKVAAMHTAALASPIPMWLRLSSLS
jgi:hypothetical protein